MKKYISTEITPKMKGTGHYFAVDDATYFKIINNDTEILMFEENNDKNLTLNIDKSWEGIIYLFCKRKVSINCPHGFIVPLHPVKKVFENEAYYFFLDKKEVEEGYKFLLSLNEESLKSKYNFNDYIRNEIFPLKSCDDGELYFEYLLENICSIKRFFKKVIQNELNLIFYIK